MLTQRVTSAREGVMASRKPREPGWYPDASDPVAERYWDGTQWHGRRRYHPFNNPPTKTPEPVSSGMSTAVWVMVMVGSVVLAIVMVCLLAWAAMGR